MSKSKFKLALQSIRTSLSKHSPEILTGIGIAGMVTTTVLAVGATPKALRLIEFEEDTHEEPLTKVEIVKAAWKCYIPAAITGGVSIACLVGASSVHVRRNALLATAYKLSESALTEYREKVIETIGEKKEQQVRDNIAKDRIEKNPPSQNEIIITEKGNTLCCDLTTNRYFKSDIDKIKKAINELNAKLLRDSYVSLNEFYDEIGISGIKNGDHLGWNIDKGLIELYFSPILDENENPCLALDFKIAPYYEFDKFF